MDQRPVDLDGDGGRWLGVEEGDVGAVVFGFAAIVEPDLEPLEAKPEGGLAAWRAQAIAPVGRHESLALLGVVGLLLDRRDADGMIILYEAVGGHVQRCRDAPVCVEAVVDRAVGERHRVVYVRAVLLAVVLDCAGAMPAQPQVPLAEGARRVAAPAQHLGHGKPVGLDERLRVSPHHT